MHEAKIREYLNSILMPREIVDRFVAKDEKGLSDYDPLGWIPRDHRSKDGVDGSVTFYQYEADRGRRVVNFPDRPSRLHTYGDSFTHCDQVSDGETWQEYLAAHLQEPIRNFGIGGWSVYQAYRRMRTVEPKDRAQYLILNVFSDDHWRNIESWRTIRMSRPRHTLPHLRVNMRAETCEEVENPCSTAEDVYRLCDSAWVWETFQDDPVLRATMVTKVLEEVTDEDAAWVAEGFGYSRDAFSDLEPKQRAEVMQREAGLFASRYAVEMAEVYAKENGCELMLILSFGMSHVKEALTGEPLFDQTFLDWLSDKTFPVIDLRDAFRQDFARHSVSLDEYLDPYYIGHHTPLGNFFVAGAIKDRIVQWLDPKPLPYR